MKVGSISRPLFRWTHQANFIRKFVDNKTLKEHQMERMSKGLPKKQKIRNVEHVVLVSSAKGGVGKSTTAVNLALALAGINKEHKVGILDADLFGPSLPLMMNLTGPVEVQSDDQMIPLINYDVKCMSMGFLVDPNAPIVWRGPMVMSAMQRLLRQVNWGQLDFLVIDMPPGTGDTQLSVSQLIFIDGVIVVTTPQDIALIDARKGAEMFRKVSVPILGLVENMSYFACPSCGHRSHIFGHGGTSVLAKDLKLPLLGQIPLDMLIQENMDKGRPIVVSHPNSAQAQSYRELATQTVSQLTKNT